MSILKLYTYPRTFIRTCESGNSRYLLFEHLMHRLHDFIVVVVGVFILKADAKLRYVQAEVHADLEPIDDPDTSSQKV